MNGRCLYTKGLTLEGCPGGVRKFDTGSQRVNQLKKTLVGQVALTAEVNPPKHRPPSPHGVNTNEGRGGQYCEQRTQT